MKVSFCRAALRIYFNWFNGFEVHDGLVGVKGEAHIASKRPSLFGVQSTWRTRGALETLIL